jgi:hypothetical protein
VRHTFCVSVLLRNGSLFNRPVRYGGQRPLRLEGAARPRDARTMIMDMVLSNSGMRLERFSQVQALGAGPQLDLR